MKIEYTYNEYKDSPEATEISESRARFGALLTGLSLCTLVLSVLLFSVDDALTSVLSILFSIAFLVYMIKFYPIATEKRIRKHFADEIELSNYLATSKYRCESINVHNKRSFGTCNKCYEKERNLVLCDIKLEKCTRHIPICESCVAKYLNQLSD